MAKEDITILHIVQVEFRIIIFYKYVIKMHVPTYNTYIHTQVYDNMIKITKSVFRHIKSQIDINN